MTEIRTRRLVLRLVGAPDIPRIAELGSDWDITSMTARMPYPYTEACAADWLASIDADEVVFGITHAGSLIGVTGFAPLANQPSHAEIGFWIGKPYWGQGFATEAVGMLIRHCFQTTRFTRLECRHFVENEASGNVIAKLGFVEVGRDACWCQARRLEQQAIRYELAKPRPLWRRLGLVGSAA
ncbi:MAG: GNAT family N-acetyltransferase [Hyphomicrobiaceae bacterium]|nr:GNAT family N-acetyltransferase [Hyphomicrobiaceae bacterium]